MSVLHDFEMRGAEHIIVGAIRSDCAREPQRLCNDCHEMTMAATRNDLELRIAVGFAGLSNAI